MERINRRRFLLNSIRGAAGISLGVTAFPGKRVLGANNKVVLSIIGAGTYGHKVITRMAKHPGVEVKYVCDVNDKKGVGTIKKLTEIQGYAPKRVVDMREVYDDKDVDGVVISTPEHWHALATVWACQAGKDVYVEKNVSLTIWEGRKMIEAARKYNRIVQSGTQNRSAQYGYKAREYIKSGKLGKVLYVKVYDMKLAGGPWKPVADEPVPYWIDCDRWQGPAQERPYNSHRRARWAYCWMYGTGELGNSASHQLDFARLAMGDPGHPKSVYAAGGRLVHKDSRETPDFQSIVYDYGDFIMTMELAEFTPYLYKSGYDIRLHDKFPEWLRNGTRIEIYGTKQMMYLGRMGGGWQVLERQGRGKNKVVKVVSEEHGRYPNELHEGNFIDCIRSRKQPNGDIEQGHYSASLVQMGNMANRVGNKLLLFDGKAEKYTNSNEANKLLKPKYRKHYRVPDKV
jgi:predicted dehydrogenase